MKVTPITEKTIQQANCDWIKAQAEELKALFRYDDRTITLNKTRAISTIDSVMDALREIKLYLENNGK